LRVPEDGFIKFLKVSFAQKRKTLWNNLKSNYPEPALRAALAHAEVKPAVRAEALPLEKSAAIFRHLSSRNGDIGPTSK
jgi:16S rRNA (adenine1518-N6/adenine1519-N6)-dimethyltransferase